MTSSFRWFNPVACCAMLLLGAAAPANARGSDADTSHVAIAGPARNAPVLQVRCPKRNKSSGTARIADVITTISTTSFNPYSGTYVPPGLFESYFVYDNHLKLLPQIAREVPSLKNGGIRDGGKTIILHLKQGLRWSNGAEITSADAKFGWRIDADQATGPACAGSCDQIARVYTPDRYTVVFRLKQVVASVIPYGLPDIWPTRWPGAWNGDPHVAALKLGTDPTFNFKGPNYPTDGPYQVARVLENKQIVLKPMKYYSTMNCGASVSAIEDVLYPSLASQIAAAAGGHIDQVNAGPQALELLPEIQRHTNAYRLHLDPVFQFDFLLFNLDPSYNGADNPLHDSRVRLALALAVDKPHLIERALGLKAKQARNAVAWTPWINRGQLVQPFADRSIRGQWDPLVRSFQSDTGHGQALADARALLASTRWKHGFTIDLFAGAVTHNRSAVAELTPAWSKLGVKVHATFVDPTPKLFAPWDEGGLLAHGTFQAALLLVGSGVDPSVYTSAMVSSYIDRRHTDHSAPAQNYSGIDDPLIDRSFRTAGRTFDKRVRSSNYAAIQQEMNRQAYWIPLYFPPAVWMDDGRILHLSGSPASGEYWNISAWKLKTQQVQEHS